VSSFGNDGRVAVWNRAVVRDQAEFLRRYEERFRTIVEVEPETELYVVGVGADEIVKPGEDANVYFFEVFKNAAAATFHVENPDAMAAKSLWWDDLLVERNVIRINPIWAKGMSDVGPARWLR
jgi:hypothetical protein